ncbi:hypothetical protein BXZ70DRAFT_123408 [Cristinia sonorae]|uniref:Uncharacterized protein n=1 Tax=Cristinia sonorae TaxID=1940300 RepID=A0A8K0UPU9_9AGAR|nr:hypothetical protein BXZ70DRAFT_123408 [Cristinia sonorae]
MAPEPTHRVQVSSSSRCEMIAITTVCVQDTHPRRMYFGVPGRCTAERLPPQPLNRQPPSGGAIKPRPNHCEIPTFLTQSPLLQCLIHCHSTLTMPSTSLRSLSANTTPPPAHARLEDPYPTNLRIARNKVSVPLSLKERIFGAKPRISKKQDFVAVYGSSSQSYAHNLIALEDAQTRPAIRLRSVQHLTPDLLMTDFPGVKLLDLREAGARAGVKYRSVM